MANRRIASINIRKLGVAILAYIRIRYNTPARNIYIHTFIQQIKAKQTKVQHLIQEYCTSLKTGILYNMENRNFVQHRKQEYCTSLLRWGMHHGLHDSIHHRLPIYYSLCSHGPGSPNACIDVSNCQINITTLMFQIQPMYVFPLLNWPLTSHYYRVSRS